MNPLPLVTGVVLAGGASSRMGTCKARVLLNGKPMIGYVTDVLSAVTDTIMVISNTDDFADLPYPVYPDVFRGCGPLGGIHSALTHTTTEINVVVSCDMPFVTSHIIRVLLDAQASTMVTVPVHNGNTEPLCGIYSRRAATTIEKLLQRQQWKMMDALKILTTTYVDVSSMGIADHCFTNINTPGELQKYDRPSTHFQGEN